MALPRLVFREVLQNAEKIYMQCTHQGAAWAIAPSCEPMALSCGGTIADGLGVSRFTLNTEATGIFIACNTFELTFGSQ